MSRFLRFGKAVCLAVAVSAGAAWGGVVGEASVGFGQVGVSVFGTDFFSFSNGQCNQPGSGAGCFALVGGTGTFANHTNFAAQSNTIQDLVAPPLSGAIARPSFMSFDNGAIIFDLIYVVPGGGQNCATAGNLRAANLSCSIFVDYGSQASPDVQISPYLLTNGPAGNTVGVSASMYFGAYTPDAPSDVSSYIGIFSTQLAGTTINDLYSVIANGGTKTSSWSASFSPNSAPHDTAAAPEPGTILLAVTGCAIVGMYRFSGNWRRSSFR